AVDSKGQEGASDPVKIVIVPDTTPPTVTLAAPLDGTHVVEDQNLLLAVGGVDDVRTRRVEIRMVPAGAGGGDSLVQREGETDAQFEARKRATLVRAAQPRFILTDPPAVGGDPHTFFVTAFVPAEEIV